MGIAPGVLPSRNNDVEDNATKARIDEANPFGAMSDKAVHNGRRFFGSLNRPQTIIYCIYGISRTEPAAS